LARRVLSGLQHQQGDRSADHRSPPAGLCRHTGARSAVFVVSRPGADAEADRAVRPPAGAARA
jgi:hypothetical protein